MKLQSEQLIADIEFLSSLMSSSTSSIQSTFQKVHVTKSGYSKINSLMLQTLFGLTEKELCSKAAVSVVGTKEIDRNGQYWIKLKEHADDDGLKNVSFFSLKRALIPLAIDLISLSLAIATMPPSAGLPLVGLVMNVTNNLTTLERDESGGAALLTYEHFLQTKYKLLDQVPGKQCEVTTDALLNNYSDKDREKLELALSILVEKGILVKSVEGDKVIWKESW